METSVLKVDPTNPESDVIGRAAAVVRSGGLVAFPTETVYGLGANGLSAAAVAGIFEAKGRPSTNPLILHVSDASEVLNVAAAWPATAQTLAARFWPGPLTLVVPKRDSVPNIVTAGGPTVAVRCPNHAVARALIRAAGVPLAAPSANRSTELSPTRAEHVLKGLNGRIAIVLDGGPCSGGLESTVVDVTGEIPRVLRPGLITVPMLEAVCGRVEVGTKSEGVARAPGQMVKHYSPRTPLVLVDRADEAERARAAASRLGLRAVVVGFDLPLTAASMYRAMMFEPDQYAADLYAVLHELDNGRYDQIVVEMPPDTPEWAAVRDRLTRAAARE
ncbi:Threonylcarbamoyl-AMP synthase [Gemmata obscuriglobus]|uniref:L-threonylcarbamoyladenylate synthase n=1 Tax=Gemmata obscuriglobus TaxID=114 RepID=UPI00016C524F|nr:L-threonylcarbamoyladenylate synthase [Gemmata obscuriglobus]QEG25585.1 Threonylcarbamoyl-AMP synthase [Gemmata obscuriglobus]VTR99025.1 translation factor sua5 : Threonylcarbamoyl-AMP synthase OS=Koribacter versatilis (strain Ellin345) GN=Acid345_4092 PE=3 SV=1: Sua5_yciO_yrdC: SUA5 [Gemmata obscuriglobus UQM 2246]